MSLLRLPNEIVLLIFDFTVDRQTISKTSLLQTFILQSICKHLSTNMHQYFEKVWKRALSWLTNSEGDLLMEKQIEKKGTRRVYSLLRQVMCRHMKHNKLKITMLGDCKFRNVVGTRFHSWCWETNDHFQVGWTV